MSLLNQKTKGPHKDIYKILFDAPVGLENNEVECFKEENMYYTEKETKDYLAGTSYMETYNAMKDHDDWN